MECEYLPLLQIRQKWTGNGHRNQVGDLVLLTDQHLPRNQWSLGRVVEVYPDQDGIVRVVKVRNTKKKKRDILILKLVFQSWCAQLLN